MAKSFKKWRISSGIGFRKLMNFKKDLGPVVQSIVSLTSSFRGQLVKCFTTLQPNTLNFFFVEKMRKASALQKLLTFFQQKYWQI